MEDFEARALRQVAYKHSHWFWYVDMTPVSSGPMNFSS